MKSSTLPKPGESLADYVHRLRSALGMSQQAVAEKSSIHAQSIGKIERGHTTVLKAKTKRGLAYALDVPEAHLEAAAKGIAVEETGALKFCPQCWQPGNAPDPMWLHVHAHYCFRCGSSLRHRCVQCDSPITSLKHRFCPYCGTAYTTPEKTE
ncbi:MAG: Double zinc ribbon/Helix-turn-helix domain [Phormidesmis priestleyi Ana]|uniref:Double zinc ribbon/Helix-turn-helix domain n=1 Tax=Phormidesmis priestleyi Ana TaxID=1666911 RepID=A0A0P7Z8T9_9CYAN|nr:MAG: Double zinc ribbon/Helix-turn-helix domain [Phormidesmis priestleyi Ana]